MNGRQRQHDSARPMGTEGGLLVTDSLLLSVFPILVVFAACAASRLNDRFAVKVVIGAVGLIASPQ